MSEIITASGAFQQWLGRGCELAERKRTLDFDIGDWAREGLEQHTEQFELALEQAGFDKKRVISAVRVAKEFPPALRNAALSFDHHKEVLRLPKPDQLDLLKQAGEKRWKPRELHEAVVKRRYEGNADFTDEDVDSYLVSRLVKEWNRATPKARQDFSELMSVVSFGIIDEDVAYD